MTDTRALVHRHTGADPAELVRTHTSLAPDFPSPGILFRDLSGLFADGAAFRAVLDALAGRFDFDAVAGAEARGFLLAAGIGVVTGAAVLPLRKPGKLPPPVLAESYTLEYGTAELQLRDGILTGSRVLIVDDVLATGGTLAAARRLIERSGNEVVGAAVVIELAALGGRAALPGLDVTAVLVEED